MTEAARPAVRVRARTPAELAVTHRHVQLPGVRLHVVEAGTGPVVLLLHGFPETWWSWRSQVQPLVEAGFRVVAPDLRGYGDSGKAGPWDVDTLTADVCALIESLGPEGRVRVVGHDWGGAITWHLAATRPERCERFVVLNCPHPTRLREALLTRPHWGQVRRSWYMYAFSLPWLPEWWLTRRDAGNLVRLVRASAVDRGHFGADELRPFRDAIQQPGAARAMVGWYRAALRDGLRGAHAASPLITTPGLLIWGLGDPALDFEALVPGTQRLVPGLVVKTIDRCGHFVHAEQPEQVNALLKEFLQAPP